MRRMFLLGASAVVVMALISFFQTRTSVSLSRVADKVERADVIPEETRNELKRLIEMVNRDGRSDRNVVRIERAMQIKPAQHPAAR